MDQHHNAGSEQRDRLLADADRLTAEAADADQAGDDDLAAGLRADAAASERAAADADHQAHIDDERRRAQLAATVMARHQAATTDPSLTR